jgi:hypothetical protein
MRALFATIVTFGLLLTPVTVYPQEKKDQPSKPSKEEGGQPGKKAEGEKPSGGAGTKPAGAPAGEMSPEMEAAMKAMTPGPPHQKLAKLAGNWTAKSKLIHDPSAPAEETECTAKLAMDMDGRFLVEEFTGTMMGMPFTSTKLLGYNNGSKKYEGVWRYTLGTGIMTLSGTSDDGGKTIKCDASFDNEIGVRETITITYKFLDDDHFTVQMAAGKMPDGTPGPVMEVSYTRKK